MCRCEDGCISACHKPQPTTYRTIPREAGEVPPPPPTIFEPLDAVAFAALPAELAAEVAQRHRIEAAHAVFQGDFAREAGEETAIVAADGVTVFDRDGDRIARLELDVVVEREVIAVRLVDERAELVVHHLRGEQEFVSVLRVIGAAVAEVFVAPASNDVTFVHHGDERAIRRLPAPDARCADADCVYRWNNWEGMFRVVRPAPTAPK